MNLKVNPENPNPLFPQPFHQKHRLLSKSAGFHKNYLIINDKTGDIKSTHLIKGVFGKIKDIFSFHNWSNSEQPQVKVLNFLGNENHLIDSEEDQKYVRDLASCAGKEAKKLFNVPSFCQKCSFHKQTVNENTVQEKKLVSSKMTRTARVYLISAAGIAVLLALGWVYALKPKISAAPVQNKMSKPLEPDLFAEETNASNSMKKINEEKIKQTLPESPMDQARKEAQFWNKASVYALPAVAAITALGSVIAIGGCLLGNKKNSFIEDEKVFKDSENLLKKMSKIKKKQLISSELPTENEIYQITIKDYEILRQKFDNEKKCTFSVTCAHLSEEPRESKSIQEELRLLIGCTDKNNKHSCQIFKNLQSLTKKETRKALLIDLQKFLQGDYTTKKILNLENLTFYNNLIRIIEKRLRLLNNKTEENENYQKVIKDYECLKQPFDDRLKKTFDLNAVSLGGKARKLKSLQEELRLLIGCTIKKPAYSSEIFENLCFLAEREKNQQILKSLKYFLLSNFNRSCYDNIKHYNKLIKTIENRIKIINKENNQIQQNIESSKILKSHLYRNNKKDTVLINTARIEYINNNNKK